MHLDESSLVRVGVAEHCQLSCSSFARLWRPPRRLLSVSRLSLMDSIRSRAECLGGPVADLVRTGPLRTFATLHVEHSFRFNEQE